MKYPRENSAANTRIELLLDIAMQVNHPKLLTVTTDEAKLITLARVGMAGLLFGLAVKLEAGIKPGKQ